jgi:hypothetical protein
VDQSMEIPSRRGNMALVQYLMTTFTIVFCSKFLRVGLLPPAPVFTALGGGGGGGSIEI